MLPVLFQSYFQYASSIHGYNTRYASIQNSYKPKERTNSGKQTVTFAASVLWDNKTLSAVLFQSYFQNASSIYGYNTRYVSKENLCKPIERTNSGKQRVAFAASVLWDNIPVDLKILNVSSIFQKN